jgi:hypothetical protein
MNSLKKSIDSLNNSENKKTSKKSSLDTNSSIFSKPTKTKRSINNESINNDSLEKLSKMNTIISDNIKSNEENINNFKNSQDLNKSKTNAFTVFFKILDGIKNIIIIALVLFILILVSIFIFRDKLINLISNIFDPKKNKDTPKEKKSSEKNEINELEKKIKDKINNQEEVEGNSSENSKNGFCYIGKINNKRSCAKISDQRYCMSGEFFSTKKLCEAGNIKNN